ncbi:hypothetical protein KC332_g11700 [Hortaea werneckii]|uniref:BTB domain-containing protein n=2 Tax=Hortaea werneckii TaxID=91943 RepID=A0A3M7IDI5_HORWE|nr:hypothetical protein KC358_g13561 [Hortaea werneckii]OTA24673.1 hypothetical protein BTJ68_12796 [Hortaea werneckii EXF-2000]KAI6807608.1 hypothetical protein KC350_g13695 [Hortaea werneckii]KAI6914320.1 hypothetical protein KC348_g12265 [Hortaea werneckii]KAI6927865.1 hypothetical protein KC341_g11877 [Hortaea werneckii]
MSLPSKPSPRPLVPVAFSDLMESLADDEMVNIMLDHNDTVLRIQRTLLLNLSAWFKTALTSGFMEGQSLTLRFPGFPSEVVQTFVYWIFHGTIPWSKDSSEGGMLKTHEELQALLARLWMFGEEHLLPKLQDQAIWGLTDLLTYRFPAVELLLEVYEGTAPDSPLRKLMANEAASGWRGRVRLFPTQSSPVYSRTDLDRVGAIPGFTADFAIALERQVVQAHLSDDERDACLWRLRGA